MGEERSEIDKKKIKKEKVENVFRELINDDNKDEFFIRKVAYSSIMNVQLRGIEGLSKVFYRQDHTTKEWLIETEGTNMRDVMNHTEIDFRHVLSNNMWEIFQILGIEAARSFLITELTSIISFGGTFVDPSHIALLADCMTYTGSISSVNRYGIGKGIGVLTQASFEQSHQTMLNAPVKGMKDDLTTVSASIIMGKQMGIGDTYFDILTDVKKLKSMKISTPPKKFVPRVRDTRPKTASSFVFRDGGGVKERTDLPPMTEKIGEKAFKKYEKQKEQEDDSDQEYIDI